MAKKDKKLINYWEKFSKTNHKLIWAGVSVVCLMLLYLIVTLGYWVGNRNRIYPGVSVAGINLSGKTKEEAMKILDENTKKYQTGQINFSSGKPTLISASDLGIVFDNANTAEDAIEAGNSNPFLLGKRKDIPLRVNYDGDALYQSIDKINDGIQTAVVNSSLKNVNGALSVIPGKEGGRVNYAATAADFKRAVEDLASRVEVSEFSVGPTFNQADLVGHEEEITKISATPLTLQSAAGNFEASSEKILGWVRLSSDLPAGNKFYGDIFLENLDQAQNSIISTELVSNYLMEIAPKINRAPVNAALTITGGKATVFALSQDGRELDISESASKIIDALETGQKSVELAVNIKKADINETSLDEMGIKELISTGYTNFSGSPSNRLHNIRTGAAKFNGVLIKPDQEFSFLTTLGPVDASTGYLPELVIKEDKTVPEYGGGMCQVSSTAFRAALNAGLPIVKRMYHAYPVSYYKPYGVDATVYIPSPDLSFKNDTGHYILIQTHIEGSRLSFDFYGTKPARTIKFAGSADAAGAVFPVELVTPAIYDKEARGKGSFTAQFWRFIYDAAGTLVTKSTWVSKYDSPDKYPH